MQTSEAAKLDHVFTVRGRPVGFRSERFGGALVAVERGYFPISPTGYRSLAGHFGGGAGEVPDISPDFLETLARSDDQARRALLTQLARAPKVEHDPLGNYIWISGRAVQAVQAALFAPDAESETLWGGAFRLLSLIDTDRRFQPASTAPAWTAEACANALEDARELLAYVRRVAAGDFSQRPPGLHFGVSGCFELPENPARERAFALPELTAEFALDLPPTTEADEGDEEWEPDAILAHAREEETPIENSDQLSLF